MFPGPTELLLTGYSNQFGPKNPNQVHWHQKPTRRHTDKGKFHTWRMESIIFCVYLTLAISVVQIVLKWCQKERKKHQVKKESQQSQDQWWVWLQGLLSSSASESPEKRTYESQSPLSVQPEKYERTGQPVVGRDTSHEPGHHHRFVESTYSASYSGWDDDKAWPSQE